MRFFLLILTAFCAIGAQADYARSYYDSQPVLTTTAPDATIAYRVFNAAPKHDKVLLIMGLGGSGAAWGDAFIQRIVNEGYEVAVIDNRDTGDSTSFASWGEPTIWWQLLKYNLGFSVDAPYSLQDMATDNLAVLDALNYDSAHVVGVSMGGMIAQVLAAQHPNRVATLSSIMSTTFAPHLPPPTGAAEDNLLNLAGGTAEVSREDMMRARGFHPESMTRQLMAIFKTGDRTEEVATITRPTLVIHGSEDPLIPPEHGVHTAEQIAGSKFVLIEGMEHSLPETVQPRIVGLLAEHFKAHASASEDLAIAALLDGLHQDAHTGDFDNYFARYTENAIFLGTDKTERWPINEFKDYAKPAFEDGHGWTYTVVERHLEGAGSTRWFDEILTNEKLGTCRGTGTVTYMDGTWKIGQYSLTLLIPNTIASQVGGMSMAAEAH
jgi:pimeloyl-ACP methyl ester carboxylesterase